MLKLPATFDAFSSRADGSMGLRFSTQELGSPELNHIHSHVRRFGWLLFSENDVQSGDIPKEEVSDEKSPSKRQRAVLFLLWKQHGSSGNFENYYRERMEQTIERLKHEIDSYE